MFRGIGNGSSSRGVRSSSEYNYDYDYLSGSIIEDEDGRGGSNGRRRRRNRKGGGGYIDPSSRRAARKSRLRKLQFSLIAGVFAYGFGPSIWRFIKPFLKEAEEAIGDFVPTMLNGKFMGRYPNSLLTLFYPYTLLRDVVLDQPVPESDIPFFWYIHKPDEIIGKKVLSECFGLTLVELKDKASIKKAIDVNLVSGLDRFKHVVVSPHIRETCEIFSIENFGRMFSFFRHPLDYDLVPEMPTFPSKDNYLVRLLSDVHKDRIWHKELGVAKKVVYVTTLVGRVDDGQMVDSIDRMYKYFGWKFAPGKDESCFEEIVEKHNPEETYIDHDGEEWKAFYEENLLDCQLYEQSHATWRGQIQTAIPYDIQLQRDAPDPDEEEEEEE